jgi:nucleoside-diphosphate-sugar epimerase
MRVFVTGATGFLGGHVVRQLLSGGHDVTALVRRPYEARHLADAGCRLVQGDLTDPGSIRTGMQDCSGVIHMAAQYETGLSGPDRGWRTEQMARINVDGTRHVLEAMRDLDIPRGVYTSTLAVNGDERLTAYDETKWRAHFEVAQPLMDAGLPLVIVQPGLVYGPGDHSSIHQAFIDWYRGRLPAIPRDSTFAWAHVEDVARGHVLALERGTPGRTYALAGPAHTLVEAFDVAARLSRRRPPRIQISGAVAARLAAGAALLERVLPLPASYSAETFRLASGVNWSADASDAARATARAARDELGWTCRPIETGFKDTLADAALAASIRKRPIHRNPTRP